MEDSGVEVSLFLACVVVPLMITNTLSSSRCLDVILKLQKCCDHCDNKSTHCASVKPLLQQITKKASQHKAPQ